MAFDSTSWTLDGLTKAGATSTTTQSLVTGNLTATTLTMSGASQFNSTLTVGEDDTGYDVKFFGATSGKYMLWDESDDKLIVSGNINITGTQLRLTNSSSTEMYFEGASIANISSEGTMYFLAGPIDTWTDDDDFTDQMHWGTAGEYSQMVLRSADACRGKLGIGTTSPANKLHVTNPDGNGLSVLKLEQLDIDEPFVRFEGTTASNQSRSLSTDTSVGSLEGHVRVSINGTDKWIAYYAIN